jgi:hypothetical protein
MFIFLCASSGLSKVNQEIMLKDIEIQNDNLVEWLAEDDDICRGAFKMALEWSSPSAVEYVTAEAD